MALFSKRHPLTREEMEQNGYKQYTFKQIIQKFCYSRFNRDPYVPTAPGEDINNSRRYRLYNKADVMELFSLFVEFLEDLLKTESVEDISISSNLTLYREVELPKIKSVSSMDRKLKPDIPEGDTYYITCGRYEYKLRYSGEVKEKLYEKWEEDPRRKKRVEELLPELEQKNKGVKNGK